MKIVENKKVEYLVELIDRLAPINNQFRKINNPIEKIETMWEFGKIINEYLTKYNLKLHELLYKIYDPHSTIKMSYITRDLGSYSYRVFSFFEKKEKIKKDLSGLKSYTLFRETVPLLFNEKYRLSDLKKKEVLRHITSNRDPRTLISEIKSIKKNILPIYNPRNQKSKEYEPLKFYLLDMNKKLKDFYIKDEVLSDKNKINIFRKNNSARNGLVSILMALASEAFLDKIKSINIKTLDSSQRKLYLLAVGNNRDRARFRKWGISSTNLLTIAEAIYCLDNPQNYKSVKGKFIKEEKLIEK